MSEARDRQKKIIQVAETQMVNHETGQILHEEKTNVVRLPQEPPFVKLYLEDVAKVLELPQGPQSLLLALVRKLDFDGMISLTPTARDRISDTLKIKVTTFNNYLTTLVEREVLKRVGRGEYEMNPHLLAKGDWQAVQKRRANFRLTVIYKPDGTKTVSGSLDRQEELPLDPPPQQAAE